MNDQPVAYPGNGEPASTVVVREFHSITVRCECDSRVLITYRVQVIGSRDNVWSAAARCAANLLINIEETVARSEVIYLDPASVPRIIGKGGARINLIRSASKCKVTIDQSQQGSQVTSCMLEVMNLFTSIWLTCVVILAISFNRAVRRKSWQHVC